MQGVPVQLMLAFGVIILSVGIIAATVVFRLVSPKSVGKRRLSSAAQAGARDAGSAQLLIGGGDGRRRLWVPKSVRDMSRLERRAAQAGYRRPGVATAFALAEVVVPAVAVLAAFAWFGWHTASGWVVAAIGAALGYLAPGLLLDQKTIARRRRIENALPDALDLLIVCLEAGSSLDQSIVKATEELDIAYPDLCDELRIVTTEVRAGKPRLEAFRNLAQRTKVDDVRALVSMLTQTDRFGTSVSQALRTLAESMRDRRQQAAEEKANKLGVKLVFPLALCLFPAFIVVALGPAILTLVKTLAGAK